jgi:hypothetical protein
MFRAGWNFGAVVKTAAIVVLLGITTTGAQSPAPSQPPTGAAVDPCQAECALQICDWQQDTRVCEHKHDARSCDRCLVSAFGKCAQRGNDPICEASKTTQNVSYDADYNSCEASRAVQNANYNAAHAACEALAVSKKASCEIAKAICRATVPSAVHP